MSSKNMNANVPDEHDLETIFSIARPRMAPPQLIEHRVRRAVHAEWRRTAGVSEGRKGRVYFAAAAAIVLALAAALLLPRPGQHEVLFASVQLARVDGSAAIIRDGRETALTDLARIQIQDGDLLRTDGKGGIALRLPAGQQLRLGSASLVRFGAAGRIKLDSGKIYVNSGDTSARYGNDIVIATPLGEVRHLGTRFQVTTSANRLRVDVREGKVAVANARGGDSIAGPGQSVLINRDSQSRLAEAPAFGEQWEWVDKLVPPLAIEGRSLYEVIMWAAEESGRESDFEDAEVERAARATTLHGGLVLNAPLPGLQRVMLTTSMQYVLQDNRIHVIRRR